MRALIQRVVRAQACESGAQNSVIAAIGKGMLILVGFDPSDTPTRVEQLAGKIRALRIFCDAQGKMNLPSFDVSAEFLVVSQFTLYADCRHGNRPSFQRAAGKGPAKEHFDRFVSTLKQLVGEEHVKHTPFGSDLAVELVNDGPVTIWLESTEVL
jgi:D-tyrosyl-tRNA(Tyr) deacylase